MPANTLKTGLDFEEEIKAKHNHKVLLVLSFVSLLLALCLFLALVIIYSYNKVPITTTNKNPKTTFKTAVPTPTVFANKFTTLSFNPAVLTAVAGKTYNLNLLLDTKSNIVTGVELVLSYDPKVMEITSVSPAGFYEKPEILENKIDNVKGIVNYSVGSMTPKAGNGNLLTVVVRAKAAGKSELAFKEQPKIAAKGEGTNNVLLSAKSAVIEVK